jgi:hypothetical protein
MLRGATNLPLFFGGAKPPKADCMPGKNPVGFQLLRSIHMAVMEAVNGAIAAPARRSMN